MTSTWSLSFPGYKGLTEDVETEFRVCLNLFAGGLPCTSGHLIVSDSMCIKMTSTTGRLAGQNPPTMTMKSPMDSAQCPLLGSRLSSKKVEARCLHLDRSTLSASALSSGEISCRLLFPLLLLLLLPPFSSSSFPLTSMGRTAEEKHGLQGPGMTQRGVCEMFSSFCARTMSGSDTILRDIISSSILALC